MDGSAGTAPESGMKPPSQPLHAAHLQALLPRVPMNLPFPPPAHIQSLMAATMQQLAANAGNPGGLMMPPPPTGMTLPVSAPVPSGGQRPSANMKPRGNSRGKWTPEEVGAPALCGCFRKLPLSQPVFGGIHRMSNCVPRLRSLKVKDGRRLQRVYRDARTFNACIAGKR
jgi:hypothetical protein